MKIKIFNITTCVIYLVVFNESLYQNKFVMEKHIKFIIETDTHIDLLNTNKRTCKSEQIKNLIKKY